LSTKIERLVAKRFFSFLVSNGLEWEDASPETQERYLAAVRSLADDGLVQYGEQARLEAGRDEFDFGKWWGEVQQQVSGAVEELKRVFRNM